VVERQQRDGGGVAQILLNNLLDTSQLAIPTDDVDEERLRRPSPWDIAFIRRFMVVFGPLSSLFDFATFAVMLVVLHAGAVEFRSGWFVESLATQTSSSSRSAPAGCRFFRSRPSLPSPWPHWPWSPSERSCRQRR
jgi:Mg2+-importing ATPase